MSLRSSRSSPSNEPNTTSKEESLETDKKRTRASFEVDAPSTHDEEEDENEDTHHRRRDQENSAEMNEMPASKRAKLGDSEALALPTSLSSSTSSVSDDSNNQKDQEETSLSRSEPTKTVQPSKVLFLRNLPFDCEEHEILALTRSHNAQDVVVLSKQRQAFLEFDSIDSASKFLQETSGVITVRERPVYAMFSDRQDISQSSKEERPNFILLATLSNVMYPITVDVLHQVFSRYGDVNKIVVFSKSNNTQALVQLADVQSATTAKAALDGQNIYTNCCKLRIVYSKMQDLNVKYNNDLTRDYTNPNLPSEPEYSEREPMQPPHGYPAPGPFSRMMRTDTPVVFVNNVNSKVTCDHLFTFFGLYGDVERVKILPSAKSSALVEFTSVYGANNALTCLVDQPVPLFGSLVHVARSNHYNISVPRSQGTSEGQFQDYHLSPLHRFRSRHSKVANHICPPGRVLHVSNVAATTTEQEFRDFFQQYGPIISVKFFGERQVNDTAIKMAIVEFDSLEKAILALIELHNQRIHDLKVKVSFADRKDRPSSSSSSSRRSPYPHQRPPRRDVHSSRGDDRSYSSRKAPYDSSSFSRRPR